MNCKEVKEGISDYLYGELSVEKEKAFDLHFSSCTDCMEEKELFKKASSFLNKAEVLEVSPELRTRLKTKLRRTVLEKESRSRCPENLRTTLEPFVNAFKPALAGIAIAVVLALFSLGRLGEGKFSSASLLLFGIVWGGTYNSIFKCLMNGKSYLKKGELDMKLIVYGGLIALTLATVAAFLLPVPSVYELPQYRPWYKELSKHVPYEVAYFLPLVYAFVASLACGIFISRKAQNKKVLHAILSGGIYALLMVPAIYTQCIPFSWNMYIAWAIGSVVGAIGGGAVGGVVGEKIGEHKN